MQVDGGAFAFGAVAALDVGLRKTIDYFERLLVQSGEPVPARADPIPLPRRAVNQ